MALEKILRGLKIAAIVLFSFLCFAILGFEIVSVQTFSYLGIAIFAITAYCEVLLGL